MESFGFVVGMALGLLVVIGAAAIMPSPLLAEAIQRGYAQYCPNDGQWAWRGECE